MTEVNIPLWGEYGRPHAGTSGRVYDRYFQVEIRDPDTDKPLPRGTVGEIMVRPKAAFGFMTGYRDMPERTVEAWRNLWFHTGDAGVMAEDGYVTTLTASRTAFDGVARTFPPLRSNYPSRGWKAWQKWLHTPSRQVSLGAKTRSCWPSSLPMAPPSIRTSSLPLRNVRYHASRSRVSSR